MAEFVYVKDFGSFHAGDQVDVPDGAAVPAEYLAPVVVLDGPEADAAELARLAAIAEAEKNLAALEAADAHDKG